MFGIVRQNRQRLLCVTKSRAPGAASCVYCVWTKAACGREMFHHTRSDHPQHTHSPHPSPSLSRAPVSSSFSPSIRLHLSVHPYINPFQSPLFLSLSLSLPPLSSIAPHRLSFLSKPFSHPLLRLVFFP